MQSGSPQSTLLNPQNLLTAHRVSRHTPPSLIEGSLRLTADLFPEESTAALGLQHAYDAIMFSDGKIEDCELFDYFIYTAGPADRCEVVGGSGLYRLTTLEPHLKEALQRLISDPPATCQFLRDTPRSPEEYVWGGRLGIKRGHACSPHTLPFIAEHVLGTAVRLIKSKDFAPALLAFTRRHNNDSVHRFYASLSFVKTGEALEFAGETQDIFVMSLSSDAPALLRMSEVTSKMLARGAGRTRTHEGV